MELLFCLNTSCVILQFPTKMSWQFFFSAGSAFPGLEGKSRQPLKYFGEGKWLHPRVKIPSWQLSLGYVIGNSAWTKKGKRFCE